MISILGAGISITRHGLSPRTFQSYSQVTLSVLISSPSLSKRRWAKRHSWACSHLSTKWKGSETKELSLRILAHVTFTCNLRLWSISSSKWRASNRITCLWTNWRCSTSSNKKDSKLWWTFQKRSKPLKSSEFFKAQPSTTLSTWVPFMSTKLSLVSISQTITFQAH